MRWPDVVEAVAQVAAADEAVRAIYGEAVRMAGVQELEIPSLEYRLITEGRPLEIWSPIIVQWDQRTESLDDLLTSERALMDLFDLGDEDVPLVGGLRMWSRYDGGDSILDGPDRPNLFGRAVRFRFMPVRRRYAAAPAP